jgi:hypothetical protein
MTAVAQTIVGQAMATNATANVSGQQSHGWLGTSFQLCLVPLVLVLHLPLLIFFGVIVAAGALMGRKSA